MFLKCYKWIIVHLIFKIITLLTRKVLCFKLDCFSLLWVLHSGSKKTYKAGSKDLSLWNVIKRILTLSLLAWQDIVHIWKWSYFHLIEQEFSLFSKPRRDISSSKPKYNGMKYFMKKPFHEILSVLHLNKLSFRNHFISFVQA